MQKNSEVEKYNFAYTRNRELSWLDFNRRVLEEGARENVPALERLKFVSIFSSNLDEFFMVRVGSLFDLSTVSPDEIDNKSGMTPGKQLKEIYKAIPGLIRRKQEVWRSVQEKLKQYSIRDLTYEDLTEEEQARIETYFQQFIYPVISPQVVGSHHPIPHFVNKALYVTALLKNGGGKASLGFIPIPESLPAYLIPAEGDAEKGRYIRIETILTHFAPELFGRYDVDECCTICATRNADIQFDDDKFEDEESDFRNRVSTLLKKRRSLDIMRLEIDREISREFFEKLTRRIRVRNRQVYRDETPLNMKYVFQLIGELPKSLSTPLLYPEYTPRWPESLTKGRSIIEQVKSGDHLLFFPFDAVDPFLELLNEAADRDDVLSIKITIYRLASTSRIARILCRAAENGKEVLVMMELRARFDEANNIAWSKVMEEAGCEVVYGVENYKCHSKICLITMKERGHLSYITQVGTGNYNEKTNAQYTDLSLMTASREIGEDGVAFFRNMLVNNLEGSYKELLVAPAGIRKAVLKHIDEETEKGSDGYICIKANAVTERHVIDRLQKASDAGVEIHLIIRGICCICPEVAGYTENIHVKRIVGRYLEHARIYCFGRGEEAKLYISSADLMTRNLRRRVEVACPVHDPDIRQQLLWILQTELQDESESGGFSSQDEFMKQSIHRIPQVAAKPVEPAKSRRPGLLERLRRRLSI